LPGSRVSHWSWDNGIGNVQCAASRSSSNLTASWPDVYLGVTDAGLYTLVGMGLIILFM